MTERLINTEQSSPNNKSGGIFFQPKLTINEPGDSFEREADSMADRVMGMRDINTNPNSFFKPAGSVQRKCHECEEDDKKLHRKENSEAAVQGSSQLDSYVGSLGSSGQPLPAGSKQFFESRFGHDFSSVRVHTDSVAAKSAQSINALAYTTGNNIVFNNGQYAPDSDSGKRLMAHELTHVVQQSSASDRASRSIQKKAGDACGKDFLYQFDAVANAEQEKDHRGVPRLLYTQPTGKKEDVAHYYQNQPISLTAGMNLPAGQVSKFGWRAVCYSPAAGAPEMIYWVLDEYLSKAQKAEKKDPVVPDKPKQKTDEPKDTPKEPTKQDELPGVWTYCPAPVPAVDDAAVQALIDDALKRYPGTAGKPDLSLAWGDLLGRRNKKEGCCDVNLAAAEHYMYARMEAADGRSIVTAETLDLGYYAYKSVHGPMVNAGSGICPKTRSSLDQLKWGTKGTFDGSAEYNKAHGGGFGSSPTNRFPDGTYYDPKGNFHWGPGPKM